MLTQWWWVFVDYTLESGLQLLVAMFGLAIRLGMVPWSETGRDPESDAERLPDLRDELRSFVRYSICRDAMDPKNLQDQEMVQKGPFTPEWREVYTGKQSGMSRKTCQWLSILVPSEDGSPVMQGDVWPWATTSQQGLKKASRRLISALAMYTNGRSCNNLVNVTVYGWPPEVS